MNGGDGKKRRSGPVWSEELIKVLNEIVPEGSAIGAYACGVVTVLAIVDDLEPDRELLELAARIDPSLPNAVREIYEGWRSRNREGSRH